MIKAAYQYNLLRPPIEWYPAACFAGGGIGCWLEGSAFLLPSVLSSSLAVGLLLLASYRFYQGWQVVRYRRYLHADRSYVLHTDEMPQFSDQLFLGKGFRWRNSHTQRLYDLSKHPDYAQAFNTDSKGGNPYLHGVEPNEQSVMMPLADRVGHTLVLGTTRVGKTRLEEVLVAQDIARGEVVIVFDPKGDRELLQRIYIECQQYGRLDDLLIFHLGFPHVSARYNPIGDFARLTEVANRVANQLPSSGESAAFKEFAWRFVNIIAQALVALGRKPSYELLNRYILNIDPLLFDYCQQVLPKLDTNWSEKVSDIMESLDVKNLPIHLKHRSPRMIALVQYIKQLSIDDKVLEGLCAVFHYDQTYYQKITASLSPLLEKLTTGTVAELLSPQYDDLDDPRPIFDWMQVIRGRKVVYVGLDALSDSTVATAVGNSMFADLCSVAGQLYKFGMHTGMANTDHTKAISDLPMINIHADEFNELIGNEFVPLLNKAGGAGMRVTAYTQTIADIEARLGNQAKTGQVLGNLNTIICLRVLDERTAQYVTHKLPQRVRIADWVQQHSRHDSISLSDTQHFGTSQSESLQYKEVPMLSAEHLLALPVGQAVCLLSGGQLWKIRIPLASHDGDEDFPKTVPAMANIQLLSDDQPEQSFGYAN